MPASDCDRALKAGQKKAPPVPQPYPPAPDGTDLPKLSDAEILDRTRKFYVWMLDLRRAYTVTPGNHGRLESIDEHLNTLTAIGQRLGGKQ